MRECSPFCNGPLAITVGCAFSLNYLFRLIVVNVYRQDQL